ncbi:hypothetical protein D9613_004563 [Agrocybe pediades]|uniref:F-box domain-containing protein n=1 Tax=Agrocybe pediades TaxID=84607 RepID=A0A8H4QJA0_9AGAR|nr:hypothetical protein D9613_004563 [Agrocybe pediades]
MVLKRRSEEPECAHCSNPNTIHITVPSDSSSCPSVSQQCVACSRVNELELEVQEAIERVKQVISDLKRAKTEVNYQHSSIVKDFPPEILSAIFESYVSDTVASQIAVGGHYVRQNRILPVPMTLIQVCNHWRRVALSTPQIWTTIALNLNLRREEEQLCFVRAWIARTRNFPLTVHLYFCSFLWHESVIPCLQAAVSSSAQWRHLYVSSLSESVMEFLDQHIQRLPMLETLGILFSSMFSSSDSMPTNPLLARCKPAPKSIIFYGPCPPGKIGIQWEAVTTMRVEQLLTDECISMVRSSPNLVTCIFEGIVYAVRVDFHSYHANRPVVEHTKIQHFSYSSPSCPAFIFFRLKLPNLRSLGFDCPDVHRENSDWQAGVPLFFERSGLTNLEVLRLPNHFPYRSQLKPLLSMAPMLRHFILISELRRKEKTSIRGLLADLQVLAAIGSGSDDPNHHFLPNLTVLEFHLDKMVFPWKYAPQCFWPRMLNASCRRPLSTLNVVDTTRGDYMVPQGYETVRLVPSNISVILVSLKRRGYQVTFKSESDGADLFESSVNNRKAGTDDDGILEYANDFAQMALCGQ